MPIDALQLPKARGCFGPFDVIDGGCQALGHRLAVESEIICIVENVGSDAALARNDREVAKLEAVEIGRFDPQILTDIFQALATLGS